MSRKMGFLANLLGKAQGEEPKLATQIVPERNQAKTHLESYMGFYGTLETPGYAVLVTGPWGSGKTFQVKKCLPENERLYVSLFGVQTVEDLHAEVLAAAFPTLEKARNAIQATGETVKELGGLFALAGAAPKVFSAMFRRDLDPKRTLVFDDLERSRIKLEDVLGAINTYVEQKGFRVVVICHDEKLEDEFLAMKEKTFGQVIRVEPQTLDAFETFILRLRDDASLKFVEDHRGTVLGVFNQSGENSLRILRHLIEDIGRLFCALSAKHLANEQAMRDMVALFSALNIESRAGRIAAEDLANRRDIAFIGALRRGADGEAGPTPPMELASEKYSTVDLESAVLSDDVLKAMLFDGCYDVEKIRASIDSSSYFIEPTAEPPWKMVINFDELEEDVVAASVKRMGEQFEAHEILDSGEMLHVFALRLMMVEEGAKEGSLEDERERCLRYIDELLNSGRLPPRGISWRWKESFIQSYGGYAYWVTDATRPVFATIKEHLVTARERALDGVLPAAAQHLIEVMKSDVGALLSKIAPTGDVEDSYAYIPLLHKIKPEEFVDVWLSLPHKYWRTVRQALRGRYHAGGLNGDLAAESQWAREVGRLMEERALAKDGLDGLRIRRIIPDELKA